MTRPRRLAGLAAAVLAGSAVTLSSTLARAEANSDPASFSYASEQPVRLGAAAARVSGVRGTAKDAFDMNHSGPDGAGE